MVISLMQLIIYNGNGHLCISVSQISFSHYTLPNVELKPILEDLATYDISLSAERQLLRLIVEDFILCFCFSHLIKGRMNFD